MKRSYYPNYFSIDDIMVTQEKVPCIVEQDLRSLGFLDQSQLSSDLKAKEEVELPLWYILQVQRERSRSQYYNVKIPTIYRSTYGDICKADATAVDLGRLNKYFYEFGRYVSHFDRNGFVGKMIYETCRSRMKYLRDQCNNINNEHRNENKMDHIENLLLYEGIKTNKKFDEWFKTDTVRIKTSELVINHRKRKRALMEAESAVSQKR